MTASLFASYDSAPQLLANTTSRNSVMSIDLPLQSLDGLLGEDLKSTSPRDNNDNADGDNEYTLDLKPPSPVLPSNNKVTRSNSDAARFMDKMKAILKATTPTATAQVAVNCVLPPMPMVGRKRTLSEMTTDSGAWGDDLTSNLDQLINYRDVFCTQESVAAQNEKPAAAKVASAAAAAPAATTERVYVIPTENDVLCGKGGRSNNNPANQRYLELKDGMQERYMRAEKNQKKAISQELVNIVNKQWKGRFLKKEPTAGPERWYELDNEAARKKCSQALREINTPEKRAEKRARYAK